MLRDSSPSNCCPRPHREHKSTHGAEDPNREKRAEDAVLGCVRATSQRQRRGQKQSRELARRKTSGPSVLCHFTLHLQPTSQETSRVPKKVPGKVTNYGLAESEIRHKSKAQWTSRPRTIEP